MLPFYMRILLFAATWGLLLLSGESQTGVYLLFLCACSLTIYFLIPLFKRKLLLSGLLLVGTGCYGILLEETFFPFFLLLLLLYGFDAAFYSGPRNYLALLSVNGLLLILGLFLTLEAGWFIFILYLVLFLLFSVILGTLNTYIHESHEKSHLYEQLLGEYRRIKRNAFANEQAVRNEERARITREIHDSVGHKLTALSMQIEMLLMKEENEFLREMKNTVNESLEETRKAVRTLAVDEIEGISSVIHLIRKLESESQLRIRFVTKQGVLSTPLSNQSSIVLYRVLQESLTNAMKHGNSREVDIVLGISAIGQLTFEIKNRYDATKPIYEGFGLRNMRERVEETGGRLQFYGMDEYFTTEGMIPVKEGEL